MNFISSLLANLNYGTVFFLMLLESTVIPVPSELVVAPASYMAADGSMHAWLVVLLLPWEPTVVPPSTTWPDTIWAGLSSIGLPPARWASYA